MPTAKKSDEAATSAAPVPAETTEVTYDGIRAIDTTYDEDGNAVSASPRLATFAEQVAALAPQVLAQAVGIVPGAADGTVSTDGGVITIALRPL